MTDGNPLESAAAAMQALYESNIEPDLRIFGQNF